MIKKLFIYFWNARGQFVRYFITGCSGVLLDIVTLYVFKEFMYLSPVSAVILNQLIIAGYIFTLNKYWSFRATGLSRKQLLRFLIILLFNYLVAIAWMWFWNHQFHFNYLLVRVANIALSVVWNFLLYKIWVFRPDNATSVCV